MKIYLVGGAVRDKLLGLPIKERDWVVVGATESDMLALGFRQVGKEFPVFLHPKTNEEYALARMERKTRPGYQGFAFDTSPEVTLEADLQRRDLTINAMAESDQGDLIDPYGGRKDLQNKILRHVSPAFAEDPVRILRVGRFLARYAELGFHVADETMMLMRNMVAAGEADALVAERVWKELDRALAETHPEKFFAVLEECGALPVLFPGLNANGTGMRAMISAAQLSFPAIVRFAALLHDVPEPRQNIKSICRRYRAPNDYQELAELTARHYQAALDARSMTPSALLDLLSALDVFRREKRFHLFLKTCQAVAAARKTPFERSWLETAASIVKNIPVQPLINEGHTGESLASELKKKRQENLDKWLRSGA